MAKMRDPDCLKCSLPFSPIGRFNRLCSSCREQNESSTDGDRYGSEADTENWALRFGAFLNSNSRPGGDI